MKKTVYKIILYIGIFLLTSYFALFLIIAPYIATNFLPNKLKTEKNIDLHIDNFFTNPLLLTFKLDNLTLKEHNKTIAKIDSIFIDINTIKTIFSGVNINSVVLQKPTLNICMDENKTLNFIKLLEKFKSKEEKEKSIFCIKSFVIDNGTVNFIDHTNFESNISNINIQASQITNQKDTNGTILASALLDGIKIETSTSSFLDKNSFFSSIKVHNLELKKYINRFMDDFDLKAKLNLDANIAYVDKNISINVNDANLTNMVFNDKKSAVSVDNLNLKADYSNSALKKAFSKIKNIVINDTNSTMLKIDEINLDTISYAASLLEINRIEIAQPTLFVTILKNFETNVMNFINKYKTKNDSDTNSTLTAKIDKIDIKNANINIKDTNLENNNQFEIKNINSTFKSLNSLSPNLTLLNTTLNTPVAGSIELNGTISKINFTAKNIYLPIYEPYLQKSANINLKNGNLFVDGAVEISKNIALKANASLNSVYVTDKQNEPIVNLPLIYINKILFENNKTTISEILIKEPEAYVSIYKNQKTNLSNIMIQTNQNEKNSSSNFAVVTLKLQNGILNFSDGSLPINFSTKIRNLNGTVYALGSDVTLPTTFNFRGEIPEYGYAKIKATANLATILKNSNFNIDFENIDIDTLSPYSIKFIGYKVDDGKLWLDLNYNITNSKLVSTNKIKIKDLKLGEVVDENATSLPLSLIISLLSDSDGYMKFEIPVSGSVDNPEFDLGSVVKDAIFTTLSHIATSPFTFLASMFDSDEDELSNIYFDAGSSKLLPPQKESLSKLKQILNEKPAIKILINGTYNEESDTNSLKSKDFNRLMTKKYGETSFGESKFEFIKKEFIAKFGKEKFLDESKKYDLKATSEQEIFTQEMIYQIVDSVIVTKADLQKLALARANAIFLFLTSDNKISKDRIKINENSSESSTLKDGDVASKLEIIN